MTGFQRGILLTAGTMFLNGAIILYTQGQTLYGILSGFIGLGCILGYTYLVDKNIEVTKKQV